MTVNHNISSNIGALNARRYMDLNAAKLSKANAQLASGRVDSDPSENAAGASLGSLFATNIAVEMQASSNVTQASALIQLAAGSLTSITKLLSTMKARATQANSDTISPAARSMLDNEFQGLLTQIDTTATTTQWNGVSLFEGTGGTATRLGARAAANIDKGASTTDIDSAFILDGFVSGSVEDVHVENNGSDGANVKLQIGGQTFLGNVNFAEKGELKLTSTVDSASSITLKVTGTGLSSAGTIFSEMRTLFGLDVGTPIAVRSESSNLSSVITSVSAGTATSGRDYGLSYGFDDATKQVTYKLTDGKNIWTQSFDAHTQNDTDLGKAGRTVVFDNGLSIVTAGSNNEMKPAVGYEILDIAGGVSTSMSFQVGSAVDTTMTVTFQATTVDMLGLAGANVQTLASAAAAARVIDTALTQVNSMIATLGGQKSQLNFQGQALSLQMQNETAAKATFTDADIAESLQDATQYQALATMASSVFGKVVQEPDRLSSLVQQIIR